jgi:hypothetical protein
MASLPGSSPEVETVASDPEVDSLVPRRSPAVSLFRPGFERSGDASDPLHDRELPPARVHELFFTHLRISRLRRPHRDYTGVGRRIVAQGMGGRRMISKALVSGFVLLATGCYSGSHGGGAASADSTASGGTGGTGTATGSDSENEPVEPGERLDVRVWRLSPTQFRNEVEAMFGAELPDGTIPEGATDHGISNIAANDAIDAGNVSVLDDVTRQFSSWAVDNAPTASRCEDSFGTPECVDTFLAWFVPQAYRRAATEDDLTNLRALFEANEAEHGYDWAFGSTVRAGLLSPDFLYRSEIGPPGDSGKITLTDYEIAAALSFSVTERGPDAELFQAASEGLLGDPDERERQARRLMATSAPLWQRIFREWLGMNRIGTAAEGSGVPPELVVQMEEEYARFVEEVAVKQRGSLRELFTASYTWAQPELAAVYGVAHPGGGLARIELDPAERAGLFTQPAWLTSTATSRDDYVVRRGMGIFRDALCNEISPPPGLDVEEANSELAPPDATVREVVEIRGTDGVCGGCHAVPDPIGLAFELYDNGGAIRTTYATGNPVETSVEVPGIGQVDNAADLARALVDDERFQACFARRFAHVLVGQDLGDPEDMEWTRDAFEAFIAADTSFEEFLVAFVRHDAFIERNKGGE